VVLLGYDVTSRTSFDNVLRIWKPCIEADIPIVLIANKIDLERKVTQEEGEALSRTLATASKKPSVIYCETSAKSGEGVADCFWSATFLAIKPLHLAKYWKKLYAPVGSNHDNYIRTPADKQACSICQVAGHKAVDCEKNPARKPGSKPSVLTVSAPGQKKVWKQSKSQPTESFRDIMNEQNAAEETKAKQPKEMAATASPPIQSAMTSPATSNAVPKANVTTAAPKVPKVSEPAFAGLELGFLDPPKTKKKKKKPTTSEKPSQPLSQERATTQGTVLNAQKADVSKQESKVSIHQLPEKMAVALPSTVEINEGVEEMIKANKFNETAAKGLRALPSQNKWQLVCLWKKQQQEEKEKSTPLKPNAQANFDLHHVEAFYLYHIEAFYQEVESSCVCVLRFKQTIIRLYDPEKFPPPLSIP
jgi:hypothetical protein